MIRRWCGGHDHRFAFGIPVAIVCRRAMLVLREADRKLAARQRGVVLIHPFERGRWQEVTTLRVSSALKRLLNDQL
ncbi:hypothetical protein [Chloroflexus sp.]|uniref:hypothetical protein n=1 Tax=Chloroflexus sp. TaxID=1904827 RepID=UPI002ACED3F9|nr:hypothetical protein [Chloroflexus sp.]